jgi:uncharacterized protein
MSDHFVKDPMEAVQVGDILEFRIIGLDRERKRISLSRKTDAAARQAAPSPVAAPKAAPGSDASGGKRRLVAVKAGNSERARDGGHAVGGEQRPGDGHAGDGERRPGDGGYAGGGRPGNSGPRKPDRDDDGTMYSPFAEALRKMREGKDGKK